MVSCKTGKIYIFLFICFGFLLDGGGTQGDDESTSAEISPGCVRDIENILRGVQCKEEWALRILDSMEKIPSGLFMGRRTAVGHFEECLSVVHPNISTKHCVLELGLKKEAPNMTFIVTQAALARVRTLQFGYGVCMPSSCSTKDLENSVKALGIDDIFTARVNESSCTTELNPKLRVKDYMTIALGVCLVILAVASTAYEAYTSNRKIGQSELFKSFSLLSNARSLFDVGEQANEIGSLNGIRFFSFTWLVLGHLYVGMANAGHNANPLHTLEIFVRESHIPGSNSYLCVDTFFFLSGLLACFIFFRNISKEGSYDFTTALIHRYLRLTPSLLAVMLFNFTIMSLLIVGPYSKALSGRAEKDCRDNWWAYLLYVQNPIQKGSDHCFAAVWYLCADMQMFLLSPLILYVLLLWPKFGPLYLTGLTLAATSISFAVSYTEDTLPNPTFQITAKNRAFHTYEYHLFITRMVPWLVGIGTAYFICGIKANRISFNPKRNWIIIGWLTSAFLCLSSLYGIAAFYPVFGRTPHSQLAYSSYRALHRLGWALGLSWIVIACVNNCGGVLNTFLSYQGFRPLGKLTYCAYLNHVSVQSYRYFNDLKSLQYYSNFELIHTYLGDVFMSLGLAVPMTLLIEMPFAQVEKILLKNLVIFPYPKPKVKKLDDLFTIKNDKDVIKNAKNSWEGSR